MLELNNAEINEINGGVNMGLVVTRALLLESGTWGPVGFAFGAGYAAGTYLYNNHLRDLILG